MAGRVASYGQSHPGSPAYWWMVKKKLDAQVKRRKFRAQELPLFFMTGTAAEYHWPEVRRVLALVSGLSGFPEEAVLIRAEVGRGGPALHRAITRFPAIVNELFELRTAAFFSTVLEGGLGVVQHLRKYEFGKHAGHAHWHSLLYGGEMSLILQRPLDPTLQEPTLDAMVAPAPAPEPVAARPRLQDAPGPALETILVHLHCLDRVRLAAALAIIEVHHCDVTCTYPSLLAASRTEAAATILQSAVRTHFQLWRMASIDVD